ncbi:hypothetical protein BDV23DRAFT_193006 [Aspergillus alliaceus]|uniref:RBR-type E3 ubiquitin transferase n=1 Tax=Petromyces alliaceus TaxID=209559 RepID=A0A5N7CQG4_PETAA|nr:hypothetical protein BDV23DRAFT_193006 [Aspergillus alliaceus]
MEGDGSRELALQLLLEDLDQLEDMQKGKQVVGNRTDIELAIETMRDSVLAAQTSIKDQTIAISTSTAIATDQNILMSLKRDERVAEQDRQYAIGLDSNAPLDWTRREPVQEYDEENDAVSTVMGDLMDRMTLSDIITNGEGSSRTRTFGMECVSCLEQGDVTTSFTSSCGHIFCRDCTRQLFLGATQDEELYPPRCCGQIMPPGIALRILDYNELRAFSERAIEYAAKDRVYCAEPTCSKFIPPWAIEGEHGTCPECHREMHLPCRSLAHPGVDCPMDDTLQCVLAMADTEKWRRCFNCRTMVELQHGCNHITCRCGREFCYVCGLVWKSCSCPRWHVNRLVAMGNQAVEEEAGPNADIAVRQAIYNRVVENLRHHDDVGCEHYRNSQWAWRNRGSLQCEVCNHILPEYIFMCTNCRMRACNRCRRHRLR